MTTQLPALYQLADQYVALADKLADLDLDEQTVTETLEGAAGDIEAKALEMAKMIRNFEGALAALDTEIERMTSRRSGYAKRAAKVKEYLHYNLKRAGILKVASVTGPGILIKKNPPSVVIDDASKVPDDYRRIPDMPMPEPDKKAIKKAIDAGIEVQGARLIVDATHIQVR